MSLFHCNFLKDLIGSFVRVNRGGPEAQKGTIVAVCSDYFVLRNEKGELYYYQIRHLKSVTKNVKDCKADDCEWLECECEDDFEKLLQSFKYRWVKINRGGPEKVEGILQDVSCEFVTLIVKEEVILVAISHIKSVTVECGEDEESNSESNNSGRARAQRQSSRGR
ncbi:MULTISPECIES: hypothetical protein [Bacillus]|uniref:Spore coat protein n=1 Tax=Bacillus thuringiensis subsp. finitimus TaxID=29337 RepID=A0A243GM42_BACTF|nr:MULTISPECIES: hypothetical protein [Bacillus]ALQ66180.1 spore coat protein [Bacillus thuringiensis]MBH0346594.1 spore coat protein [Bacillus thuringiensis]MDA1908482.1 spore coat protein [Bacillus cereus]MDA2168994.1 spore coat protein [Bacillus cereus]MDQ7234200.1 spore coat protein [Bacillus pacificus]